MSVKMDAAVGMQPTAVASQDVATKQASTSATSTGGATEGAAKDEKAVVSKIEPSTVLRAEIIALQRRRAVINRGAGEIATISTQLDRVEITLVELRSATEQLANSDEGSTRVELTIQFTSIRARLQGLESKTQFPGPRLDKALAAMPNQTVFEEPDGTTYESSAPLTAPFVRPDNFFGRYLNLDDGSSTLQSSTNNVLNRIDYALDRLTTLREQYSTLGDRLTSRLDEIGNELADKQGEAGAPLDATKASTLALQVQAQLSEFPGIAKAAQYVDASRAAVLLSSTKSPDLEPPKDLGSLVDKLKLSLAHRERQLERATASRVAADEMTDLLTQMRTLTERGMDLTVGFADRVEIGTAYQEIFAAVESLANETKFLSDNLVSTLGEPGTYHEHSSGYYYLPREGGGDFARLANLATTPGAFASGAMTATGANFLYSQLVSGVPAAQDLKGVARAIEHRLYVSIYYDQIRLENLEAANPQPKDLDAAVASTQGAGSPPVAPSLAAQLAQVGLSIPPIVLELDE